MMRAPMECPKCQGKMGQGVIVDVGYGQSCVAAFLPGEATISRWFGLKVRKKDLIPTQSFRCGRCGFLENYAPPV